MSEVFISYARSTAQQARAVAEALRGAGHDVWLDDELPAHRPYTDVIVERLRSAKAVVVVWSAEAVSSHWVRAEANAALEAGTLVQLSIDGAVPPLPFNQIQCADMNGWSGDVEAAGWRKVVGSIAELLGGEAVTAPASNTPILALPSKPSIAVLPFANLSGDPEQDYFADGMVEEITGALTRIRSIFVIASGSGLSFKGNAISPQEAARQLGVRYVLEGSVRKAANRVRIAVKLMDASDGSQTWADRFEDSLDDVFALQDKVALAVAARIEPTVQLAEIQRASARPTENMGSYDLYLRAYPGVLSFNQVRMTQSLDLLNRAIALDSDFGPALSLAAVCHQTILLFGWSDDPEASHRRGVELAHRAIKSVGDDAMVLAWSASALAYLDGDADTFLALAERALALNPGSAFVRLTNCAVRTVVGEPDLAFDHLEASMRLDPRGPNRPLQMLFLGLVRFQQGRFGDAVPALLEFGHATDHPTAPAMLAATYGLLGRSSEARDALAHFRALTPQGFDVYARAISRRPEHRETFLDGIALAEGKPPAEAGGVKT